MSTICIAIHLRTGYRIHKINCLFVAVDKRGTEHATADSFDGIMECCDWLCDHTYAVAGLS